MPEPTYSFTLPAPPATSAAAPPPPAVAPHPAPVALAGGARPRLNKALWLIGIGLLANAAVLLYTHATGHAPDLVLDQAAYGQSLAPNGNPSQPLGARGIYMMPAQLGPQTYGLYLMDVDSGTICVYRALPEVSHFRLMAARSFRYDRFLEDFNNETLRPKEVQKLVEEQRQRQELQQRGEQPTVDQTPKPDQNLPDGPSRGALPQPGPGVPPGQSPSSVELPK